MAPHSFTINWLAPRLPGLLARGDAPEIELTISRDLAPLQMGAVDLAIVSGPRDWKDLVVEPLGPMPGVLACAPTLIGGKPPPEQLDELAQHRLLGLSFAARPVGALAVRRRLRRPAAARGDPLRHRIAALRGGGSRSRAGYRGALSGRPGTGIGPAAAHRQRERAAWHGLLPGVRQPEGAPPGRRAGLLHLGACRGRGHAESFRHPRLTPRRARACYLNCPRSVTDPPCTPSICMRGAARLVTRPLFAGRAFMRGFFLRRELCNGRPEMGLRRS